MAGASEIVECPNGFFDEPALNHREAGRGDDLAMTADYKAVYELVRRIEAAQHYQLMEALAYDVIQAILREFDLDEVTVRVRKQSVPLGGLVDHAEVEMTRRKGEPE